MGASLGALVGSVLPTFFAQPGIADVLGQAAGALAAAWVAGKEDFRLLLPDVVEGLRENTDIQSAVGMTVGVVVQQFVGDAALAQGLGDALGGMVTSLVGDSAVQQFARDQVAALVTNALAKSPAFAPIAGQVGQAVGAAIQQFLAAPGWARVWARWSVRCCRTSSAKPVSPKRWVRQPTPWRWHGLPGTCPPPCPA